MNKTNAITSYAEAFRKHLENFIKLSDDEFDNISDYFTHKKYKKNDSLIREGEYVQHTYWIINGLVTSNYTDTKDKEHIVQFAIENCWITDQNAFYNRQKAIFNIVCMEPTEVLSISYNNREKLCAEMQKMEHFFRKKGNDSFVKLQQRLLTYLTADAEKRFELLLDEYPQLIQRLSKKTLAAYLGVSRETLSRFKR